VIYCCKTAIDILKAGHFLQRGDNIDFCDQSALQQQLAQQVRALPLLHDRFLELLMSDVLVLSEHVTQAFLSLRGTVNHGAILSHLPQIL